MTTKTEVLKLALEALKENQHLVADNQPHAYVMEYNSIIEKCEEALAQTEQEPVAWEQFYPDIGKPQIEQPKVRTGDCLLVGVCASEGHKIQAKQEPWRESASDYERGVIDGRQMQRQSNVDKAVNRMAQPEQEPATKEQIREAMIFNLPLYTTPPQRTWVRLTDEDIERIKLLTFEKEINTDGEEQEAVNLDQLIRAAEQLCKEKNNV